MAQLISTISTSTLSLLPHSGQDETNLNPWFASLTKTPAPFLFPLNKKAGRFPPSSEPRKLLLIDQGSSSVSAHATAATPNQSGRSAVVAESVPAWVVDTYPSPEPYSPAYHSQPGKA